MPTLTNALVNFKSFSYICYKFILRFYSIQILDFPPSTFIDLVSNGWQKGVLFVNGKNLGRYWAVGPQKATYIPGPILKFGRNEILIFEEEQKGSKITFAAKID